MRKVGVCPVPRNALKQFDPTVLRRCADCMRRKRVWIVSHRHFGGIRFVYLVEKRFRVIDLDPLSIQAAHGLHLGL